MRYEKIKGWVLTSLVLCMWLLLFSRDVAAETGTGTIKGSNVNVRSGAGTVAAKVVTVSKGDVVIVLGSANDTAGKKWYQVRFTKNGKEYTGYIIQDYVNYTASQNTNQSSGDTQSSGDNSSSGENQSAGDTTTTSKWKGKVTGTNVNVRKKAVSGAVIGSVSKDKSVTVQKAKKGSDGKDWYYISVKINGSTKKGWIRSDFVKKVETTQTTNESDTSSKGENQAGDSTEKNGTLKGNYVRVRKQAVNGAVICQLMNGAALTIEGQTTGSDNMIWLKVSFIYNGSQKSGYVRSDFVKVTENQGENSTEKNEEDGEEIIPTDGDFEAYLDSQGFPESYREKLRSLHNAHPEWTFKGVATDLKWDDVIAAESKVGTNLVAKNAITSWKSTETTAYNWKKNSWYTFDGGAWVAASREIVQYYMDPRNFLTEKAIFQFESLEYESYQNAEGVNRLLAGTFMKGELTEPSGKVRNYARTFVKIGKTVGVSPYHLAARCYQEQGNGKSGSISGKVSGYENIFNYYNIGAYAANGNSPVVQGLIYASKSTDNSATNYSRPWNSHYKSLLGGAEYVAEKYVKVGQNTLYFQKFNVVNTKNGIYRHQYMTNIQAAESEAVKMSKAYGEDAKELVFYIPVYKEMPETVCALPTSNQNPNNYLASLEVENQQLTPVFDPNVTTYDLTVEKKVKKVNIIASAVASTSAVDGTGTVKLQRGSNTFNITCKSESGIEKVYTINIVRK